MWMDTITRIPQIDSGVKTDNQIRDQVVLELTPTETTGTCGLVLVQVAILALKPITEVLHGLPR